MQSACLVDTTRCTGCRSCQVACKQSNHLGGETTKFFSAPGGYQNPARFSPRTFTYISYHELESPNGEPSWVFVKRQCLHCTHVYCAYVCAPEVFRTTPSGVVACRPDLCIGCAACVDACPFEAPALDYWNVATPQIRKCTFCLQRQESKHDEAKIDGKSLSGSALSRHQESLRTPACAKACPTGAILFGDRAELLREAKRRIAARPDTYVDHVYGENEAGGTAWLYLSRVPFKDLGFPTSFENPDSYRKMRVGSSQRSRGPLASLESGLGWLVAGVAWFFNRREDVHACPTRDRD